MTHTVFSELPEYDGRRVFDFSHHRTLRYNPNFEYEARCIRTDGSDVSCRLEYDGEYWHWLVDGERCLLAESIKPFMLVGKLITLWAYDEGFTECLLNF